MDGGGLQEGVAVQGGLRSFPSRWNRPARRQKAPTKQLVSLRLDFDVIAHFKAQGAGWQTRINKALRKAMAASEAK